jgi:long-subunit fatty acid transport protein
LRLALVCALALVASTPSRRALAFGGLELSPGGTRALGRGGAITARPEDPFAMIQNPAGLAVVPADQLILDVGVSLQNMCETPYGYYGWGVYSPGNSQFGDPTKAPYATDALDRVCNSTPPAALPGIAYDMRINDDLGIGFGMLAPTVLGALQYGGVDGTIQGANGPRPTPTRYQLVQQALTAAFAPAVGVGYRVLPRLRIGVTFQWVGAATETTAVQSQGSGTNPMTDMLVRVRAHDYFIPGVTLGVLATPIDSFDVALAARMYDSFNGSGDARYTTFPYLRGATSGHIPFQNDPMTLSSVQSNLPWVFSAGFRYANPLPGVPADARGVARRGDPLGTERFDVELDFGYQLNARTSHVRATVDGGEVIARSVSGPPDILKVTNASFDQDRHLADSVTVRVGSTYNVIPKRLGVSAGTFYESRGVDPAYANIDTFSFSRIGVGLGLVARVSRWDFALAYGHVFQETLIVAPPDNQPRQNATDNPASGFDKRVGAPQEATGGVVLVERNSPSASQIDGRAKFQQPALLPSPTARARVVNAGVYEASYNTISASAAYRF